METKITPAPTTFHTFWQSLTNMTPANLTMTPPAHVNGSCGVQNELQSSLAVLYTIIFIPGLVGNLVALWVFLFVHSKKNSVHIFLINIALADLLLMVCLPFRVLYHSQGNRWRLGQTLCNLVGHLFYMNMYISITLLGLISVDRYRKLHRGSVMEGRLTVRSSAVVCALIWAGALSVMMPVLMSKNPAQNQCAEKCFHYKQLLENKWKAYINAGLVVVFWLVFIILIASYAKIGRYLKKRSHENPDFPSASKYKCSAKKSFFILFLFTLCFVPYHLVRILYIKTQISETSHFWKGVADRANEITLVFSALNSCLDPVMYFFLSSSVRREVGRLTDRMAWLREVAVNRVSSSTADWDRAVMSDKDREMDIDPSVMRVEDEKSCIDQIESSENIHH